MTTSWTDTRVPPANQCVLRYVLERWAGDTPEAVLVRFADGTEWTYAHMLEETRRAAAGLHALGVRQGTAVLSWLPNGADALRCWFGIAYLGAVYVPINTAYRGHLLEHVIRNADAALMLAHGSLVERLEGIELSALKQLVVTSPGPTPTRLITHGREALQGDPDSLPPAPDIKPWDTQAIIYTSGTTGPSKGVLSSYLHLYSTAFEPLHFLDASDRWLMASPLFHVSGTVGVAAALLRGASFALVDSFKVDAFWDTVRTTRSTTTVLLSSMVTLLAKLPPDPRDRDHTLRHIYMIPLSVDVLAFNRRFGIDVYTVFNMTETSSPLASERNPTVLGSCGAPRAGVQARLVDANDCEVPLGTPGELLVRCDRPWAMNHGYNRDPEATARAWRNGWFHTGDTFRKDETGNFFYVDRLKDAIRRRGENISSFEVELAVCSHPSVREAVAVAVPSEEVEDEVLIAVVPQPGVVFDPVLLTQYLVERLPHFMVPRYIRLMEKLPKTPTEKVEKHRVRAEGITTDTWDRERAGIVVKRDRL